MVFFCNVDTECVDAVAIKLNFKLNYDRQSVGQSTIFYCPNSWDYPNLEGQVPHIYIPQEQGGADIPPGTGFPFRRLLRLAGLRWRCSNPPPHGMVASRETLVYVS
jgi:hypothetical protein